MSVNIPVVGTGDTGPVSVAAESTPQGAVQLFKLAISDSGIVTLVPADPAKGIAVDIRSMPLVQLAEQDGLPARVTVEPGEGKLLIEGRPDGYPVPVSLIPSILAGQGWDKKAFAAASTTVQVLKLQAGEIGGYYIYNPNASVAYVQLFDLITKVTLGTTVPDMFLGIPASSAANIHIAGGISFYKGIQFACATTALGSTAVGTGLDINFWFK